MVLGAPDLDSDVKQLVDEGLLTIKREDFDSEDYKDRFDYHLTKKGKDFVENRVVPPLENEDLSEEIFEELERIKKRFWRVSTYQAVKRVHEELWLDEDKEFHDTIKNTKNSLYTVFKELEGREDVGHSSAVIHSLGACEFSIVALSKIEKSIEKIGDYVVPDPITGNNHVLYNTQHLLEFIENHLLTHHLPRHENEEWTEECLQLGRKARFILHKIELNSDVYAIQRTLKTPYSNLPDYIESVEELIPCDSKTPEETETALQ